MSVDSFIEEIMASSGGVRMIKHDCFVFERYKFDNEAAAYMVYKKLKELSFEVFISDNIIVLFKDVYV
jgi:hypothetical protein